MIALYAIGCFYCLLKICNALGACLIGLRSRHWPSVPGTILSSGLSTVYRRNDLTPPVAANVSYSYFVDGKAFTGSNITAGGKNPTYARLPFMAAMEDPYKKDMSVTVYYDRNDPATSSLEPGVYWKDVVELAMFSLLLLTLAAHAFLAMNPPAKTLQEMDRFFPGANIPATGAARQ